MTASATTALRPPTVTASEQVALLDLLQGTLADCRRHWLAGDHAAAAAAAEDALRARLAGQAATVDADRRDAVLQAADAIMADRLSLLGQPPSALGQPADWSLWYRRDPTANGHLANFRWAGRLAEAYALTGDERYAERWCALVDDFIAAAPWAGDHTGPLPVTYFPARPAVANRWRACDNGEPDWESAGHWISLCAATRALAWLEGLAQIATSAALRGERLWRVLRSLAWDHAQVLIGNPRHNTPNQVIETSAALLHLGLGLPELRMGSVCFELGYRRLLQAMADQVHPDGSDLERSPNYNWGLPPILARLGELLGAEGADWAAPFLAYARRRLRFQVHLATPDLGMVDLRKAHHADDLRPYLMRWSRHFDEPESLWIASAGREGRRPAFDSVSIPYGAFHVLRSGYQPTAEYALLAVPQDAGAGHSSEDVLGLVLAAGGHRLLVDSGNYSYNEQTDVDRAMARYCFASRSHSVVLVDGHGQGRIAQGRRDPERLCRPPERTARHTVPDPARTLRGAQVEYAEGRYDAGFGPGAALRVAHHRRLFWIRGRGWLVVDHLQPADGDAHDYRALWMLAPAFAGRCVLDPERLTCVAGSEGGPRLTLRAWTPGAAAIDLACGEDEPCRGWYCVDYGVRVPKPDLAVSWRGTGAQTALTWIDAGLAAPLDAATSAYREAATASLGLRFADGATLELDVGPEVAPRRIDGAERHADCLLLWGTGGEREYLALGTDDPAAPQRSSDGRTWSPCPPLPTLIDTAAAAAQA